MVTLDAASYGLPLLLVWSSPLPAGWGLRRYSRNSDAGLLGQPRPP